MGKKTFSRPRSKYGNIRVTVDSIKFASKAEAKRYGELKLLLKAGEISGLELQPKYELKVNGALIGRYTPDFDYLERGQLVTEEVKGFAARDWPLRRKLFEAIYGRKIRVINNQKRRRAHVAI